MWLRAAQRAAIVAGMGGTLLSIGHGYCAQALAGLLRPQGWRIVATTRSTEKAEALRAGGIEAVVWPGSPLAPVLAGASHVLSSVAPDGEGDPVLRAAGDDIAVARHLAWVGYLSTTGVYGDHGGGWVDEDTPPAPTGARGLARVAAEAGWRDVCTRAGVPLQIFRLAGIYGPGRGPFGRIRSGQAQRVIKPGQVFSRIHVADIATALAAGMARPGTRADTGARIYNLCDDEPAAPQDVTAFAAGLLGLPPPPEVDFTTAPLSPMAREFYRDSRRVRNDRAKAELGWVPRYPDYRSGLRAVLAAEAGAGDQRG